MGCKNSQKASTDEMARLSTGINENDQRPNLKYSNENARSGSRYLGYWDGDFIMGIITPLMDV